MRRGRGGRRERGERGERGGGGRRRGGGENFKEGEDKVNKERSMRRILRWRLRGGREGKGKVYK